MTEATGTGATGTGAIGTVTVRESEARHFGAMADDWWDPRGRSAPLHRLNPVRLAYLRERADPHWGLDPRSFRPLDGRSALDVGCGAGLLAEPLARLGATVTGLDAAPELVAAAEVHARGAGLEIAYRAGGTEALGADERFDLVTCMEVVEHADDQRGLVRSLAGALAENGLLVMSTPNRTALSRTVIVEGAEAIGAIPRGTHDWHRFLTPDELGAMLVQAGLRVTDVRGIGLSASRGFRLTDSTALDYLVTAVRA